MNRRIVRKLCAFLATNFELYVEFSLILAINLPADSHKGGGSSST